MTVQVYNFSIAVAIKDGEVIDSWGYCEGAPLTGPVVSRYGAMTESIDYSDFEAIALRKYREWMEGQAEDAADRKRGK